MENYIYILLGVMVTNCFIAGMYYQDSDRKFIDYVMVILLIFFALIFHTFYFIFTIMKNIIVNSNIKFWYKYYMGKYKNMPYNDLYTANERAYTIYKDDKSFQRGLKLINKQNNYTHSQN